MTLKYRKPIESIPNWHLLTDSQIAFRLTEKSILWQDPEWWSVWGVAGVIGAENVKPFLTRLRSTEWDWVADALVGNKAPFGDVNVNNMMLASGDPEMIAIARECVKYISICDQFKVPNDSETIMRESKQMRVEILQQAKLRVDADRWNKHVIAVQLWDGTPENEPNL